MKIPSKATDTQRYAKRAGEGRLPLVVQCLLCFISGTKGHEADAVESSFEIESYAFATSSLADLNPPLIPA